MHNHVFTPPDLIRACQVTTEDSILIENNEEKCTFSPLSLVVSHDYLTNCATFYFSNKFDEEKLTIAALDIEYLFDEKKIKINQNVKCLRSSQAYELDLQHHVDRHIFYTTFFCSVSFSNEEQIYKTIFKIEIPQLKDDKNNWASLASLNQYYPDKSIINIYKRNFEDHSSLLFSERDLLFQLTTKALNRSELMKYALYIDDLTNQDSLSKYTMQNVKFMRKGEKAPFTFAADQVPLEFEETQLLIIPMLKFQTTEALTMPDEKEKDCMTAFIHSYENGIVSFFVPRPKHIDLQNEYGVRFIPNRIGCRASIDGLLDISRYKLDRFFEDFEVCPQKTKVFKQSSKRFKTSDFVWRNENIGSNREQRNAIKNIVNCTNFPYPYIVYGPAGTGKTSCLVECIVQIINLKPDSKIVVTTQSNSACDEIGERLLNYIPISKILRLYSESMLRNINVVSKKLLPTSNLRNKRKGEFPTKSELAHFSVVLCTLITSSKLKRAGLNNHFDYILVDECAATTEPENLVPIAGLGCLSSEITANIVLFGDHKQLPPVIKSEVANKLGLGVSLMERMMTKRRYQQNPDFDNNYVTQLLNNFRSHHAILRFSNNEFYESKLRAKNKSEEVMIGTKWDRLPNKSFPILFHSENNPSELDGTSSFNMAEAKLVKFYVDQFLRFGIGSEKIKSSDIGVITPYKAQVAKLRQILPNGIEIGTSEYWQGREKLIVLISTVKSKSSVGFLRDQRRLNVCLTRAKALMIVIGNGNTLKKDEVWKRFILHCLNNGACVGNWIYREDAEKRAVETQEDENNNNNPVVKVYDENNNAKSDESSDQMQQIAKRLDALLEKLTLNSNKSNESTTSEQFQSENDSLNVTLRKENSDQGNSDNESFITAFDSFSIGDGSQKSEVYFTE